MAQRPQICRWHVLADTEALERDAVSRILAAARETLADAGAFRLVLTGGKTPRRIYAALGRCAADWARWHIYFGDERCLPANDPERNSRMAADAWLDRVPIPRAQIHAIPAEANARQGAAAYARTLAGLPDFDLVLLGLGEDGHTASLFPGDPPGAEDGAPDVLPVFGAPKPPPQRVSLSARRLAAARRVIFLVSGAGKKAAVDAWRTGAAVPAAAVAPPGGVDVLVDFPPAE